MTLQHQQLGAGKWFQLTLSEQMGNIGGEAHRAASAQNANNQDFDLAVRRALELIDLTLNDPRHRGRIKEIARLRDLFCAAATGDTIYNTSLKDIDVYLTQFALAARLQR
ncbi:MAG: hypothetical protein AAB539_00065 [Patescibacteria group bacterium]